MNNTPEVLRALRQTRNKILRFPEAYNQTKFAGECKTAPCDTAACIFGWLYYFLTKPSLSILRRKGREAYGDDIYFSVKKALGLSEGEAFSMSLYNGSGWPEPYRTQFQQAKTPEQKSRAAANYLNFVIRTGKVT